MHIRRMQEVFLDSAEGLCGGLPYNTELVSSAGCAIVFWCGEAFDQEKLDKALQLARGARDIVSASASLGQPTHFWAQQNIGETHAEIPATANPFITNNNGKQLPLTEASKKDWAEQWPTEKLGEIFVSEGSGTAHGSVFTYWIGTRDPEDATLQATIQKHVKDHDVIGVHFIRALPDKVHASISTAEEVLQDYPALAEQTVIFKI